jgi:ParB-like chromosome segregation protein Spo0J
VTLKRNPQYLTPSQMENLKTSIQRDGFCAPVLVRPLEQNLYEVISGNHRFMASQELGIKNVPCVVANLSDKAAKRLAVNLNTIHGQPNPELLAPFLAEFEIPDLADIFIEKEMKEELLKWDDTLAEMLSGFEAPDAMNRDSPKHQIHVCICPKCGASHARKEL